MLMVSLAKLQPPGTIPIVVRRRSKASFSLFLELLVCRKENPMLRVFISRGAVFKMPSCEYVDLASILFNIVTVYRPPICSASSSLCRYGRLMKTGGDNIDVTLLCLGLISLTRNMLKGQTNGNKRRHND